jgi:hypothetical protein
MMGAVTWVWASHASRARCKRRRGRVRLSSDEHIMQKQKL